MSLTIRPATEADADILAEMMAEFSAHHREDSHVTPEKIRTNLITRTDEFTTLIGEWDGAVAAFAIANAGFEITVAERGLYLSDLHVRPAFRRHGIARALIAHLAAQAKADDQTFVWWFVQPDNPTADRFYATLGSETLPVTAHAVMGEPFEALAEDG